MSLRALTMKLHLWCLANGRRDTRTRADRAGGAVGGVSCQGGMEPSHFGQLGTCRLQNLLLIISDPRFRHFRPLVACLRHWRSAGRTCAGKKEVLSSPPKRLQDTASERQCLLWEALYSSVNILTPKTLLSSHFLICRCPVMSDCSSGLNLRVCPVYPLAWFSVFLQLFRSLH